MVRNLELGGVQTKQQVVEALKDLYPVTILCKLLQLSRSGYYKFLKRKEQDPDHELKDCIQAIHLMREKKYGYRRIQAELERLGRKVNHKRCCA